MEWIVWGIIGAVAVSIGIGWAAAKHTRRAFIGVPRDCCPHCGGPLDVARAHNIIFAYGDMECLDCGKITNMRREWTVR